MMRQSHLSPRAPFLLGGRGGKQLICGVFHKKDNGCPDTELVVKYGNCQACSWPSDTRLISRRFLADHNPVGTIRRFSLGCG